MFELSIIFIRTKAGSNHRVFTQETCSDANLWPSYGEDKGKARGKPTRGQDVLDLLCQSSMPAALKAHKYSLVRAISYMELWPKLNPTAFPEVQMPSLRSISCKSLDWQGSDPDWRNSHVILGKEFSDSGVFCRVFQPLWQAQNSSVNSSLLYEVSCVDLILLKETSLSHQNIELHCKIFWAGVRRGKKH